MRLLKLFSIVSILFTSQFIFSQENKKFSIGLGYGFDTNISNDGILLTNDYKIFLTNKLILNPGVSVFQSMNTIKRIEPGYRSHSGLVFDLSLEYEIIKIKNFGISMNLGPSFEIGDQTYSSVRTYEYGVLIDEQFVHEQIYQPGLMAGIEFSFQKNKRNTFSIVSNFQYGLLPNSVGVLYKIGL